MTIMIQLYISWWHHGFFSLLYTNTWLHIFLNFPCSSNFILPADLLEFSRRIKTYHPLHRFTLDLRFNPLNRDPKVKGQALRTLLPFCEVLTEEWDFRSAMVDHVSVMWGHLKLSRHSTGYGSLKDGSWRLHHCCALFRLRLYTCCSLLFAFIMIVLYKPFQNL